MAFSAMSYFVFGETVTANRINNFIDNDNALRDGSGLATNAVGAASIATSAIYLGGATRTSDFATSSGSNTQVTDISATVTVPAGGRKVIVMAGAPKVTASGGTATIDSYIWDGTVGSGTTLTQHTCQTNGIFPYFLCTRPLTVSAGSKTYNLGMNSSGGLTSTLTGTATLPIWIAVYTF